MARYIDADKYKEDLWVGHEYLDEDTLLTATNILDSQPTIEAEPVVRCKDCEAWQTKTAMSFLRDGIHVRCCSCSVYGRLMYDDDFCSKGKRRADE